MGVNNGVLLGQPYSGGHNGLSQRCQPCCQDLFHGFELLKQQAGSTHAHGFHGCSLGLHAASKLSLCTMRAQPLWAPWHPFFGEPPPLRSCARDPLQAR